VDVEVVVVVQIDLGIVNYRILDHSQNIVAVKKYRIEKDPGSSMGRCYTAGFDRRNSFSCITKVQPQYAHPVT
jgi:hypothetical protein